MTLTHWDAQPARTPLGSHAVFKQQFSAFELEDELFLEEGRDVMDGE